MKRGHSGGSAARSGRVGPLSSHYDGDKDCDDAIAEGASPFFPIFFPVVITLISDLHGRTV
jgi:hypothetical protein